MDALNKDKNPTSYVYKKKETFDANDPDGWKKKFKGSWTLLKREGIKEFLSGEGFSSMKVMLASNIGHQCAVSFENGDVNTKCEISGTGIPFGTIPFTELNKEEKTEWPLEGRAVGFNFSWDEAQKALIVVMDDPLYPVRKGGREMKITRYMLDDNTMNTVFAQTNHVDGSKCGYSATMKRLVE